MGTARRADPADAERAVQTYSRTPSEPYSRTPSEPYAGTAVPNEQYPTYRTSSGAP
ncbi:hypothetical protein AB0912_30945 [Streptomyces sp. NPDC007084]|uniref:hypothetical protein n=1 Tax=Streptomyces sp. NPDC007084 TaxID=3154313 RepID=UPI003452C503